MTKWSYCDGQQAGQLQVDGAVTVAQVGQLKELLARAVDQAETVLVDLSRVDQVDIAGLQLFCAAQRYAGVRGKTLRLSGGGERCRALVRTAGFVHGAWCNAREKTSCLWREWHDPC